VYKRGVRDGVDLWYVDTGSGAPPLVMVHGFAADHHHFARQISHFSRRHRIVAVDLRGHGRSAAPPGEYSIEVFSDDLAWLCGELQLERPVVMGHSMGGLVAALTAARHPEVPGAVVVLDSAVAPLAELVDGLVGWASLMHEPDHLERMIDVSDAFFGPWDDPLRKLAIQQGLCAPQHVLASAAHHMAAFVQAGVDADVNWIPAQWSVPACLVTCSVPMNDLDRLRKMCPDVVTGQLLGVGHHFLLEAPEQVNAFLERFLWILEQRRATT
jgi:pimeloyl-ACP methyl ester carboxylesterase